MKKGGEMFLCVISIYIQSKRTGTQIGEKGAMMVCVALRTNTALTKLDMSCDE